MTLSRALGAPLALSFALVAAAPAFAEDNNNHTMDVPFSCDTGDLASLSLRGLVNDHMLPGTVFIQTGPVAGTPVEEGSEMEEFLERFFEQAPEGSELPLTGLGSGFVIDGEQGYIVTNNHVIDGAGRIVVTFYDEEARNNLGVRTTASLIGTDPETDIAVLQVDMSRTLDCVTLADSDDVRVFDGLIAIGNPLGQAFTVTHGTVSNVKRTAESPYTDYIQTDASINSGNSGGPAFNYQGEVVGVNSMILSRSGGSNGIGLSIPSNTVTHVATQLIENGEMRRGWLGVSIQPVTARMAAGLGLSSDRGVLVPAVTPDGPADHAGIEDGDVILSFNGTDIGDMTDLLRAVARTSDGDTVEVMVWRDGSVVTLDATVADRNTFMEAAGQPEPEPETDAGPQSPSVAPQVTPQILTPLP